MIGLFLIPVLLGHLSVANAKGGSIVIDTESGRVMHEMNADALNYPASLTKMMTLYLLFSALENKKISLGTRWKVSSAAASQPPTKLGIRAGRTITVKDCILALVTKSANDIAVVVAEGLAGSESRFARMMTEQGRVLNMQQSTFRNASGLPDAAQMTTARDISILALALYRDFPEYYRFFSTRAFYYGKRLYRNHNHLLYAYPGTDGIKTGYIRASGYNLAASTVRQGRRLIGVVMGGMTSKDRNQQMMALLNRAFAKLEDEGSPDRRKLSEGQTPIAFDSKHPRVPKADRNKLIIDQHSQPVGTRNEVRWGIQVGAFSYFNSAQSAASLAKASAFELLQSSRTVVSTFPGRTGILYRARLIGISKQQARRTCKLLISKQISCIVVAHWKQQPAFTVR